MYLILVAEDCIQPQTQTFAKNLEVAILEQMMVSSIETHRTIWNHTNEMKIKWTIIIHKQ